MTELHKWGSIESMHNVLKWLEGRKGAVGTPIPAVNYRAKIKLHGTNAGVQITPDGDVIPQGRRSILTPQDDNVGFAKWVESEKEFFRSKRCIDPMVIYGEWCGPGIQKGTAINQIKEKIFAIFAIRTISKDSDRLMVDPSLIRERLLLLPDRVKIIPWLKVSYLIDWADRDNVREQAEQINKLVEHVEKVDPWVRVEFGVEGIGEGIVLYPILGPLPPRDECLHFMFKAKGEKHKVVKTKKSAQIDPEVAKSIDEFVTLFVTEARLEQALNEACQGKIDTKMTGAFIKWMNLDILKESEAELEASGLEWKQVVKGISQKSVTWYQEKVKEI